MGKRNSDITVYIKVLGSALRTLPEEERLDIMQEARTHLEASAQAGRLTEAMSAFGSPQAYALQFLDGEAQVRGPERGMWTTASNAAGSLVMALLAAAFVAVAVIDMMVPAFGIWVNPASGAVYFGNAGLSTRAEELAGAWLTLIAFSAAAAMALISFALARAASRGLRRYMKSSTVAGRPSRTQ